MHVQRALNTNLLRTTLRGVVLAAVTVALSGTSAAQTCAAAARRDYADIAAVLSEAKLRLDTLSIAGTVELTAIVGRGDQISFGAPTAVTLSSAAGYCRVAALWTSRGDSIAATWLFEPTSIELVAPVTSAPGLLVDKPRPVPHTSKARVVFSNVSQRVIERARSRAAGAIGRGQTTILTLVDSTGLPAVTRLLQSSGVRALDEAALSAMMVSLLSRPDSAGRPVAAWYETPISWR
jgi:hypothetical protein